MSNRANLREMRTSEQNSATTNYIKGNPLSFHIQNDKNDSRCCISAIGMHTHYLNNSIGDSEELIDMTNRNVMKKQLITQKYNSGRFQYSSQEGNPNYSSLSNTDFPDEKASTRQKNRISAINYHQQRKGKSKTSKGYYKSTTDKPELKSNSKSKKRKISKRNRSKNHENAQTPLSRTKFAKANGLTEFTAEHDSIAKKKRRKTQGAENIKHHKNVSDNSIMYTSHSCGPNIKELIDSKVSKHATTALQPSYSPYVSNNTNNRKTSQRSKSTNPHIAITQGKLNCFEGFVNIDLSQLPHDMTQREVVETMIRKHELSNFMYSDEDEDTSRYMIQNLDDRRTCRRSQYNKNTDMLTNEKQKSSNKDSRAIVIAKDSTSPIDFQKKIVLGSKSNSITCKTATLETEGVKHLHHLSKRRRESVKSSLLSDDIITQLVTKMKEDSECLEQCDKQNNKTSSKAQEEKKFFLYCNMLEELATHYPKLKNLTTMLKEGFQSTIRNIVANEVKEKGIRESSKFLKERENVCKIQKKFAEKEVKMDQQEEIIENLQNMLEKHRINGMKLQDENDRLKVELDVMRKVDVDKNSSEHYSSINSMQMFQSTDRDISLALWELREIEKQKDLAKFQKYAKAVPKLDMKKVHEVIRLKNEDDGIDSYCEGEESESSWSEREGTERLQYDLKRYYSERNDYEDSSNQEELVNAKHNIRALLNSPCLNLKLKLKMSSEAKEEEKQNLTLENKSLFNYTEKNNQSIAIDHENTIDQWEFEQNPDQDMDELEGSVVCSEKYNLYDDSSSSVGSYYSDAMYETNQENQFIPKLNLGNFKQAAQTNPFPVKPSQKNMLSLGTKLEGLKQKDFHEEFMDKYDEFSASWRDEIKQNGR
jgi:uncharacterized coiled-coil protein SlyX